MRCSNGHTTAELEVQNVECVHEAVDGVAAVGVNVLALPSQDRTHPKSSMNLFVFPVSTISCGGRGAKMVALLCFDSVHELLALPTFSE